MTAPDHKYFLELAKAVEPYLDQLVFVGAWCHRLLRFHPLATPPAFVPLMTEDADIATPERLQAKSPSLAEALTTGGFRVEMSGDGKLPVTKYYPKDAETGPYVEFIAPLRGSGYTRAGQPNDLLAASGITAQKLRFVDLLLFEPWQLPLTNQHGFDVGLQELRVQVANPASYLAQKVLTLNRRVNRAKRPKDALYIHDTLSMFASSFALLRDQAAKVLRALPAKTQREFAELCASLFMNKSLMVSAAAIAAATGRAHPPSADTIEAVCTVGLEAIFAP